MPRIKDYRFAAFATRCRQQIIEDEPELLAVDTETDGAAYYATPFCVTMSWRGREDDRIHNAYFELGDIAMNEGVVEDIMNEAAYSWGTQLIFHNAKFDLEKMSVAGMLNLKDWTPDRIHDTEAIWHLLHPNDLKSLDYLTPNRLGLSMAWVEIKSGKRKGEKRLVSASKLRMKEALKRAGLKAEDGYHLLPRRDVVKYAMEDTMFTYLLHERGYPQLEGGLLDAYHMEQEVLWALIAMETPGLALDLDYLEAKTSEFGIKIMESEAAIRKLAGDDVNPAAPAQLKVALEARGLKVESTDKKHLRKMDDDLAREILHYRYLTKVHGDKLRPMLDEQREGIIHPWIRQHGAKTGRTASGTAQIDG